VNEPPNDTDSSGGITTDLVEYFIIAVPDVGSLATLGPALTDVVQRAAIRILDLVVVVKGDDGSIDVLELDTLNTITAVLGTDVDIGGMLSENDIVLASVALRSGSVGVILVTEDRWAEPLSTAAQRAGGQIIAGERIPASRVESALAARFEPQPEGEVDR
jgi:uncharacterized protein DUF6325